MTPERRLDRLESIVKLMIKAGRRERKETREKINALIDAQMRTEEALVSFQTRTEEALAHFSLRTEEEMTRLARVQAETQESLKALIRTVDRIIGERASGQA